MWKSLFLFAGKTQHRLRFFWTCVKISAFNDKCLVMQRTELVYSCRILKRSVDWERRMDEETEKEVKCKFCLIYKYFRWKIEKLLKHVISKLQSQSHSLEDYCEWSDKSSSSTWILNCRRESFVYPEIGKLFISKTFSQDERARDRT